MVAGKSLEWCFRLPVTLSMVSNEMGDRLRITSWYVTSISGHLSQWQLSVAGKVTVGLALHWLCVRLIGPQATNTPTLVWEYGTFFTHWRCMAKSGHNHTWTGGHVKSLGQQFIYSILEWQFSTCPWCIRCWQMLLVQQGCQTGHALKNTGNMNSNHVGTPT